MLIAWPLGADFSRQIATDLQTLWLARKPKFQMIWNICIVVRLTDLIYGEFVNLDYNNVKLIFDLGCNYTGNFEFLLKELKIFNQSHHCTHSLNHPVHFYGKSKSLKINGELLKKTYSYISYYFHPKESVCIFHSIPSKVTLFKSNLLFFFLKKGSKSLLYCCVIER